MSAQVLASIFKKLFFLLWKTFVLTKVNNKDLPSETKRATADAMKEKFLSGKP